MPKGLFTREELDQLSARIRDAESGSSGEIRVHLEAHCSGDVLVRARKIFHQLGMDKTRLRNGVLIYVATEDRKAGILGDKGIHEKVSENFWQQELHLLLEHFGKKDYLIGLTEVIQQVGEKLKIYFPAEATDTDELSNEISFGA